MIPNMVIVVEGKPIASVSRTFELELHVSPEYIRRVYTAAFDLALRDRNMRLIIDVLGAVLKEHKRVAAARSQPRLHGVVQDPPAADAGERDEPGSDAG